MSEEKDQESNKISKELIAKVYDDLAHPGAAQLGKAIGTLLEFINSAALYRVEKFNLKRNIELKHNLEKLGTELSGHSEFEIAPVPNEIGVPLLEKLFYVSDRELGQLYVSLLKRAAVKEEAHLAHPAFVNCITNLSPDEAKLVLYLKGRPLEFITPYLVKHEKGELPSQYYSGMYFSDYHDKIKHLMFPKNLQVYSENLIRLGILNPTLMHADLYKDTDEGIVKRFSAVREHYTEEIDKFYGQHRASGYKEMLKFVQCEFTDFGELFLEAVFGKKS